MTIKEKLTAWYNKNIVAGWYASAALIGGWLTALLAWAPDFINWMLVDHLDYFGRFLLPTMDADTKAIVLSIYVTFLAPPLRAKIQTWMQKKVIVQQAEAGKVVPLAASGVKPAVDLTPAPVVVTEPDSPDDIAADKRIEQLRAETGQS